VDLQDAAGIVRTVYSEIVAFLVLFFFLRFLF